jgi:uncharacterized protein (TIGR04222 family)
MSEKTLYTDLHQKTKDSYMQFFGTNPPAEIWEDSFAIVLHSDMQTWQKNVASQPLLVTLGAAGVFTAFSFLLSITVLTLIPGKAFLILFILLNIIGFLVGKAINNYFCKELTEDMQKLAQIRNLTGYELAYLKSNDDRVITNSILAKLAGGNKISFEQTQKKLMISEKLTENSSILEKAAWEIIHENDGQLVPFSFHQILKKQPAFLQIKGFVADVKNQMLAHSDLFNARWIPTLIMTGVLSLGLARTLVGIMHQKPVMFLVILSMISAFIVYWWQKNWDSDLYQKYIPEYFKGLYGNPKALVANNQDEWAVSLYGTSAYSHGFMPIFIPYYGGTIGGGDTGGGGSCGSGDSGGGDSGGSGCGGGSSCGGGGCGGCGGGD